MILIITVLNFRSISTVDVKIESDVNNSVLKLSDCKPVLVKKGDPWPFLGVSGKCWYAVSTDSQGTDMSLY